MYRLLSLVFSTYMIQYNYFHSIYIVSGICYDLDLKMPPNILMCVESNWTVVVLYSTVDSSIDEFVVKRC